MKKIKLTPNQIKIVKNKNFGITSKMSDIRYIGINFNQVVMSNDLFYRNKQKLIDAFGEIEVNGEIIK